MKELICFAVLSAAAAEDIAEKRISGWKLALLAAAGLAGMYGVRRTPAEAVSALVPGIFFLALSAITGGKTGEGDAFCLLALGFGADLPDMMEILLLSLSAAGAYGVFLLLRKGRKAADEKIAFIPFIAFAYAVQRILCI